MKNHFNFSKKDDPLEKDIEKAVRAHAITFGWLVYKWQSENNRGVLDRILISPGGAILFVEFKRKGKKPTKLQQLCIDNLKERGCLAYCIDNIKAGKELIDFFEE